MEVRDTDPLITNIGLPFDHPIWESLLHQHGFCNSAGCLCDGHCHCQSHAITVTTTPRLMWIQRILRLGHDWRRGR